MGRGLRFCKMKSVPETDGGDGYITVRMFLMPPNCTLEMVKTLTFVLCVFCHNFRNFKSHNKNYRIHGKNRVGA